MGARSGIDTALLVVVPLLGLLTLPEVFTADATAERVVAALVVVGCALYVGVDIRQARGTAPAETNAVAAPRSIAETSDEAHAEREAQSPRRSAPMIVGLVVFLAVVVVGSWFLDQLGSQLLPLLLVGVLVAHRWRVRTTH